MCYINLMNVNILTLFLLFDKERSVIAEICYKDYKDLKTFKEIALICGQLYVSEGIEV